MTDDEIPSFQSLAPLLDRLVEHAERELPSPLHVTVQAFDDGDFQARVRHVYRSGGIGREVGQVHYRPETEKIELVHGTGTAEDGEVVEEERRTLEKYPSPVD